MHRALGLVSRDIVIGVVGHAPTLLVLGGAEEGSALRHAGVSDEELTPATKAALKLF